MSDHEQTGNVPPDLPPEYAEAYRRGYERALAEATRGSVGATNAGAPDAGATDPDAPDAPAGAPAAAVRNDATEPSADADDAHDHPKHRDAEAAEAATAASSAPPEDPDATAAWTPGADPSATAAWAPQFAPAVGAPPPEPPPERYGITGPVWADDDEEPTQTLDAFDRAAVVQTAEEPPEAAVERRPRERPAWLVPAILAAMVVLLIVSAYGIGRIFSSSVGSSDLESKGPDKLVMDDGGGADSGDKSQDKQEPKQPKTQGKRYQGAVTAAEIGGAKASCQAPSSVDAAGHPVRYPPRATYDGDLSTAWRCNGDGVGQTLTLNLPGKTELGEVGLVPGYAKTDPRSGADRYAQNNRITKVRWTFADGSSVVQKLDGSPDNRDPQTVRIPATATDQVVMEVLDSVRGPRNTIAVSEVRLAQTAG